MEGTAGRGRGARHYDRGQVAAYFAVTTRPRSCWRLSGLPIVVAPLPSTRGGGPSTWL